MHQKVPALDSIQSIRTALRKRTVQTAIYKNQAEQGARCQAELLAYVGFMTEEECFEFLNSIREAPFLPEVNVMWTEEVADYLMFGDLPSNSRYSMERCITEGEYFGKFIEPVSYNTSYMKKHVDEKYWHLLPAGWAANYYSPSQVLSLAIHFHSSSPLAQHIAEKLFIKAADLEDCLTPATKVPPALPRKNRVRKVTRKNELVLKDFPEGSHIAIDLPEADKPMAPNVTEIPKTRRNPVVVAQPMFAVGNERINPSREQSKEIHKVIMEHYIGFGGDKTAAELSEMLGIPAYRIYNQASRLRKRHPDARAATERRTGVTYSKEKRAEIDEAIKKCYVAFGGHMSQQALARELKIATSTVGRHVKKLRAQQSVATN